MNSKNLKDFKISEDDEIIKEIYEDFEDDENER